MAEVGEDGKKYRLCRRRCADPSLVESEETARSTTGAEEDEDDGLDSDVRNSGAKLKI
jgi:hypothetical protein